MQPDLVETASGGRRMELLAVPNWWQSGGLGVLESIKIERGRGGYLGDVLTCDGGRRRRPNFAGGQTIMEKEAGSGLLVATALHVERAQGKSREEVWRIRGSGSPFYRWRGEEKDTTKAVGELWQAAAMNARWSWWRDGCGRGRGECDNPPRKIPYYRLKPIYFGH
jgi:hypothetical protein